MPVGAILFWSHSQIATRALNSLYQQPLFQQNPEKHVLISNNEYLFLSPRVSSMRGFGWDLDHYQHLEEVTIVHCWDIYLWNQVTTPNDFLSPTGLGKPLTKRGWSISFGHEASNPDSPLEIASYDAWARKTFHFFYHTTTGTSLTNSTQYRHAPCRSDVLPDLTQPSSVGYDIPGDQWRRDFADSKFCLVIRGDTATSRALFRSIRSGCLPVVVCDMFPYLGPVFRSFLHFNDFAIMVPEADFLPNPAHALNQATNISKAQLQHKIRGLALAQRILSVDHPQSLFVQAFSLETLASRQPAYYNISNYS
jgi:hypothetical protein